MSFFQTSDGVKIYYQCKGRQEPLLVCIHGWATDSRVFQRLYASLTKRQQILLVDLRGHGRSEQDQHYQNYSYRRLGQDILELLNYLKQTQVIFIGWSMGVFILLENLSFLQPLAKGFVFIAPTPQFRANETFPCAMPKASAQRLERNLKRDYQKTLGHFYSLITWAEVISDQVEQRINTVFSQIRTDLHFEVLCATLTELYTTNYQVELSQIIKPSLIVCGQLDRICPWACAKAMANSIAQAELKVFSHCGHLPFMTQEAKFLDVITGWLDDFSGSIE